MDKVDIIYSGIFIKLMKCEKKIGKYTISIKTQSFTLLINVEKNTYTNIQGVPE